MGVFAIRVTDPLLVVTPAATSFMLSLSFCGMESEPVQIHPCAAAATVQVAVVSLLLSCRVKVRVPAEGVVMPTSIRVMVIASTTTVVLAFVATGLMMVPTTGKKRVAFDSVAKRTSKGKSLVFVGSNSIPPPKVREVEGAKGIEAISNSSLKLLPAGDEVAYVWVRSVQVVAVMVQVTVEVELLEKFRSANRKFPETIELERESLRFLYVPPSIGIAATPSLTFCALHANEL